MNIALDKYQYNAVFTRERNVLVVAAPGSGKTTVIINRVQYLISELEVNSDNIIVITFTKAAAQNMKKRYESLNNKGKTPFFGTFHALFYKILQKQYGEIKIIENIEGYNLIKKVLLTYLDEINEEKVKEVLSSIAAFKCSEATIDSYEVSMDKNIFIECFNIYENYKREKDLLDFDDLQINCMRLLHNNPILLKNYQRLFKYLLVDEFQDCDGIQLKILALLNGSSSLFAVGDEDQCIYGFRGSRPECMVNFNKSFINGKKLFLSTNYRSTENIIEIAKELIKNNILRNPKEIIASRKEEKEIKITYPVNESIEAEGIASTIEQLKAMEKSAYKDNAILYRTNVESRSLIDALIRKKLPFKLLDKEYNFFQHFICRDLLSYMILALDRTNRESFCRVVNRPFRYISRINIDKVKAYKYKEDCFDILAGISGIPIYQIKAINDLKKDIHELNKINFTQVVDNIINNLNYLDYLKEYSNKYKINISELQEVIEEFKEATFQFTSITEFLSHVEEVAKEIKNNSKIKEEDCIILSTIHGVKGMEFKNVFIVNCVEDLIPHVNSNAGKNLEEERRLMYVAVTRAIDNLFIHVPRTIRGKAREVSRFIQELKLKHNSNISLEYNMGDKIVHRAFGEGVIKEISDNEITIEFLNQIDRRFDTLILINNKLIEKVV